MFYNTFIYSNIRIYEIGHRKKKGAESNKRVLNSKKNAENKESDLSSNMIKKSSKL